MAEPLIPTPIPPKPTGASPALKAARWAAGIVACVAAAAAFVGTRGCEQSHYASSLKEGERVETVIAGKTFRLEPALDPATQVLGLGKRTSIEPDGGMIFVFPFPRRLDFVMRDCPIPIDVAFLDNAGRVMTLYAMPRLKAA